MKKLMTMCLASTAMIALPALAQTQQQAQPAEQTKAQQGRAAGIQVTQQPPQVTVRQQQPQIIVRQAPPRITVYQPQPEIIVRIPAPQVDVATQRPEVDINLREPRVEVQRAQREQVRVQAAETPQVQFEQTGEPTVEYRQAEGDPRIRYEKMGQQQNRDEARTTGAIPRQQSGQRQGAQERGGQQRGVSVMLSFEELEGMDVANALGNDLGTVNDVLVDNNNRVHVVVGYGGFLGIGEREVILPLNRFALVDDGLVIRGMSDDQLRQQPPYEPQPGFRRGDPDQQVNVRQGQDTARQNQPAQ